MIPKLEPHCGSWIVLDRMTGLPLFETFNRQNAEQAAAQEQCEVLTAAQWLARFNRRVREEAAPMRLSDCEQHKLDEAYSAHMDAVEGERRRKAERERPNAAAGVYVDIVFDGPPGPEPGRFVEVENSLGLSIRFGEWICRPDGYWVLRITASDLPGPQP